MGVAAEFKQYFEGINFYLVEVTDGVGRFKSDIVVSDNEIYFELIVSLKKTYQLTPTFYIDDIYKISTDIHDISQFELKPIRTHRLFQRNEKTI